MNYYKILNYDICNGIGWRVTLYVSGCQRNCPGCFNTCTHDPNAGKKFTESTKEFIWRELSKPEIDGLTFLGGEPLSVLSDNRKCVIEFAKETKEKFPQKNIWLYTGYTINEIEKNDTMKDILKYIDVIVDGPFIEALKDPSLHWRGSSNQNIICVKRRIEQLSTIERV